MKGKPLSKRRDDESLRDYGERLIDHLRACADNAARRHKPTMWDYYLRMADYVCDYPWDKNDEAVLRCANHVEQTARHICLVSADSGRGDKVRWYSYSVYARKILAAGGQPTRGWVSLWLRGEEHTDDA